MPRGLTGGLDALLSGVPKTVEEPEAEEPKIEEPEKVEEKPEIEEKKEDIKETESKKLKAESYDPALLRKSIAKANKNSIIGVWSPLSAAILWYLKNTTPNFSISEEVREVVEKQLAKKYPELTREIKKEMTIGEVVK